MGKYLLLLAGGLIVVGTILFGGDLARSTSFEERRASTSKSDFIAREIAMSGLSEATSAYRDDPVAAAYPNFSGTYGGGGYTTTTTVATTPVSSVTIQSRGALPSPSGSRAYVVEARYESDTAGSLGQLPPFMRYAVYGDAGITFGGNFSVAPHDGTTNANVHTNGDIAISGGSVSAAGFGTYGGTWTGHTSGFVPRSNPDGRPAIAAADPLEIPPFDFGALAAEADVTLHGNQTLTGPVDLSPQAQEPATWYIDGDLTFAGSLVINGYGILLVSGDVSTAGGTVMLNHNGSLGAESNLAVYAGGDLTLGGNALLLGQYIAANNIRITGTVDVYGSLVSLNTINHLSGTPTVHYVRAAPSLTAPLFGTGLKPVGHREWVASAPSGS